MAVSNKPSVMVASNEQLMGCGPFQYCLKRVDHILWIVSTITLTLEMSCNSQKHIHGEER